MDKYILVTTTIDDESISEKIIEELLNKRLIGCVQVREVKSSYWWKGKIETSKEFVLEMKSRKSLYSKIEQEIKRIHSYEVPEIFYTNIEDGNSEYLDWLQKELI